MNASQSSAVSEKEQKCQHDQKTATVITVIQALLSQSERRKGKKTSINSVRKNINEQKIMSWRRLNFSYLDTITKCTYLTLPHYYNSSTPSVVVSRPLIRNGNVRDRHSAFSGNN